MVLIRRFYKSVSSCRSASLTLRSRSEIFSLCDSSVNLVLGWNLLSFSEKVCSLLSPWVQIKEISSICLCHKNGWWSCVCSKACSSTPINLHVYVGKHFIAVPEICCLILSLNSKKLKQILPCLKVQKICPHLSRACLSAFSPSLSLHKCFHIPFFYQFISFYSTFLTFHHSSF